jgi:ribosomal protein S18 acetylase RimI-like enzyme
LSSHPGRPSDFWIERLTRSTPDLLEAMGRLVPQLSARRQPPSESDLTAMLGDERLHLLVGRSAAGCIQGMAVVVFYRVPTGLRARIEDVVVSEEVRGQGLGRALLLRAIQSAQEAQAHAVDLTSNPSRRAANALYLQLGFQLWKTNVYRKDLDAGER